MNDLPQSGQVNSHSSEQAVARQEYFRLRDKLVSLKSALEPNLAAIDSVVEELEQAQLAYKATYGLFGNNPLDDADPRPQFSDYEKPRTDGGG